MWFTGLSQSGKTTRADKVYDILKERGYKVERLDGDIVRESLTKDLGFSKEDRDENIKRVSFVAKLLSRNRVGVIASFISPYEKQRQGIREQVENYIEVFCDAPVEVCAARDTKGLYKKAKAGEIKNFTGISDPFEAPKDPEIHIKSIVDKKDIGKSADEVVKYLEEKKYI